MDPIAHVLRSLMLPMALSATTLAHAQTITGHRGAAGLAPENTLESVRKALELGVQRVEVDVQQTADGRIICLHDRTLDRTTDMHGKVRTARWDEIKGANANVRFEREYPNTAIPLLEEVIAAVAGKAELVIEIKDGSPYYEGIEGRVAEMVLRHGAEKWALVHSFNDDALHLLHELHPRIRLQKLLVWKSDWFPVLLDFKLRIVDLDDYPFVEAFAVHRRFVSPQLVRDCHALGKKLHVYTVNDPDEMVDLVSLGVDGIITDRPDVAMRLFYPDGK